MRKRRILTAIVGTIILGTIAGACSSGSDNAPNQAARPAFVERLKLPGGDNGLPNPFAANPRGPGTINVNFVYDTLLWKDSTGNVIPWLAESWARSPDALEYRFTLRPNIL
jgi:peptide/nickel transport system substrate-binding protein